LVAVSQKNNSGSKKREREGPESGVANTAPDLIVARTKKFIYEGRQVVSKVQRLKENEENTKKKGRSNAHGLARRGTTYRVALVVGFSTQGRQRNETRKRKKKNNKVGDEKKNK